MSCRPFPGLGGWTGPVARELYFVSICTFGKIWVEIWVKHSYINEVSEVALLEIATEFIAHVFQVAYCLDDKVNIAASAMVAAGPGADEPKIDNLFWILTEDGEDGLQIVTCQSMFIHLRGFNWRDVKAENGAH